MSFETNNSKEEIKRRMIKHALNYYDIKNGNEHDLDPMVKLLMEALSLELYNLGNDIADTQVRILEKIANLLTPDFLTSPTPAHAIIQAMPVEATENISEKTVFFAQRKISSKNDELLDTSINVRFTPVDNVMLFDAQVSFMVTGTKVFKCENALSRQLMPFKGEVTEGNTIWLGLKVNKDIQDLNNLNFYFDWRSLEHQQALQSYQLLPLAKWYIDGHEIKTNPGLNYLESKSLDIPAESVFLDYNLLSLLKRDIKSFYDAKFVTIKDTIVNSINDLKQLFPPDFNNYFRESELMKFSEKLLWIKIIFPAGLKQELIDEINICCNSFPIVNRRLNDKKHRLNRTSNIIPLETSAPEQFLSVEEVSDETTTYHSVPSRKQENEDIGTFTIRNGGVERFDSRNAKEFISYLLETLRNESVAFSAFGLDNISTPIKEISQRIALIELKTNSMANNAVEVPNYIIVKPLEGKLLMYVEYWSTLAEIANNIRSGSRLQLFTGTKVKPESLLLLTSTVGGKSRLRPEDRLNAFKYGMMTRNRIITKEDIRSFCHYELGSSLKKVVIEKGYEMSPDSQQGFNRTIDVIIYPATQSVQSTEDWQILCEQLKLKLQTRSGMSNNYRVIFGPLTLISK